MFSVNEQIRMNSGVPAQDGDLRGSWTYLLPGHTKSIAVIGMISSEKNWNWWSDPFTSANVIGSTQQKAGKSGQSHHKLHPNYDTQQLEEISNPGSSPWGTKGLYPTLDSPIKTNTWETNPRNIWLLRPMGFLPTRPLRLWWTKERKAHKVPLQRLTHPRPQCRRSPL